MSMHDVISTDTGDDAGLDMVQCVRCGGEWVAADGYLHNIAEEHADRCRTAAAGLVHGYDTSSHALDNCQQYDDTGTCEHTEHGCNCVLCTSF